MNHFQRISRALPWCSALLLTGLLAACGGGGGRDPILGIGGVAALAPTVTAVTPLNNAVGVSIATPGITATFSEPMAAIAGTASFTVTCAAPCVSPTGTVTLDASNRIASYALAAGTSLTPLTLYTATITGASSLATGLTLAAPYVWKFTTGVAPDLVRPRVLVTLPATTIPGPTPGVPINTAISATFTEDMAPASINAASFTVTCAAPCVSPAGSVSYSVVTQTASFTPGAALAASTTYTATITASATDLAGNGLAGNQAPLPAASNYVWTFTTGVAPDTTRPSVVVTAPITTIPGPTPGVPANSSVSAVFSEDMAPATISAASFTVTCAAPCVSPSGVVKYHVGTRTVVFTPAAVLATGATYTATITTAATDLAGNALAGNQAPLPAASNYVWTFTTVPAVPPANVTVQSTLPAAGAVGVCPNATVNATFDVPSGFRMDPASLNAVTFTLTGPGLTAAPASSVVLDVATGKIATFTPASLMTPGVLYTATVKGGALGVGDMAVPANTMLLDFTWTFTVGPATGLCLLPIDLGAAKTFGTYGGTAGMTNQGILTVINGDIGTTAVSTAVTGFHDPGPGCTYTETPLNVGFVNGKIYTAAPPPTVACPSEGTAATFVIATKAAADALAAYNALVALPPGSDPGAGSLANLVLAPGVYTAAAGSFMIQGGPLTLDAQGNPNAVWVFQMATSLTVGGPGAAFPQSVVLVNGAQAKNVFWQVGSAATINAAGGGIMVGTIISQAGVVMSTPGNLSVLVLNGRALSLGASVTMVNTVINVPAP
jgi:hypothetical protein